MKTFAWLTATTAAMTTVATCWVAMSAQAATFMGVKIDFNEYPFPTVQTDMAGSYGYNLLDNLTGAKLSGDNGDAIDLTIDFATTSGQASLAWESASVGRWTSNRSAKIKVATNNPGTLVATTALLRFDPHLLVTDLSAAFTSLNTSGNLWEYSVLGFLKPDGTPFSATPIVPDYNHAASFIGSPSIGWYVAASKGTVMGVGTATTISGLNGALTTTQLGNPKDDITLTYALANLAPNTPIGGLIWTTYLEDTRGMNNATSSFTASWTDLTISGVVLSSAVADPSNGGANAVPTPGLLPGLMAIGLGVWRQRDRPVRST
jgi:hypothetical protein